MRFTILPLLLAWGASFAFADEWNKQWPVSASPELRVDVGDGRISVHPGSANQIEARVTTTGWTIGPGQVTVNEHQEGNRVELEIHVPHEHFRMGNRSRDIRVDLQVPQNIATFLHTGDGAIEISGIHGNTQVRTGDGAIEATDMDGGFEAHTGDGHIHLRGRFDSLDLESGDGSIEAEAAPGSRVGSGWRVHTGDGHVTMRLPEDCKVNLDAHTGDGSITVDMPITIEGVFKGRSDLKGKINGAGDGDVLTIRTGDGPIRIEHS